MREKEKAAKVRNQSNVETGNESLRVAALAGEQQLAVMGLCPPCSVLRQVHWLLTGWSLFWNWDVVNGADFQSRSWFLAMLRIDWITGACLGM